MSQNCIIDVTRFPQRQRCFGNVWVGVAGGRSLTCNPHERSEPPQPHPEVPPKLDEGLVEGVASKQMFV